MSDKKDIRKDFREAVFKRDNFTCVICGNGPYICNAEQYFDAHHINDRSTMENGGYVKENGITLCKGISQVQKFLVLGTPEICVETTKTEGMWRWKKEVTTTEWCRFYDFSSGVKSMTKKEFDDQFLRITTGMKVIGFRDKKDAESFIEERKEETKKAVEGWRKYVASTIPDESGIIKIHKA